MLVEDLLTLPFFDKSDPSRIIRALIQFITDAAGLFVRGFHQDVQSGNQFVSLVWQGMELGNANNPGLILTNLSSCGYCPPPIWRGASRPFYERKISEAFSAFSRSCTTARTA